MSKTDLTQTSSLRALPAVDQLLRSDAVTGLRQTVGLRRLTTIVRLVTEQMRAELQHSSGKTEASGDREALQAEAIRRIEKACREDTPTGLRRVLNATGVIVHTNLGRAPLSQAARQAIAREAAGYCTLEYDSLTGSRGRRGGRVEALLAELTGAEDALVVNNCAAAALLVLTVVARDGETIVSRGELVEIGGDFRVPDVMANSGTRMIEVGTTNRTRLDDYRRAINEKTRLIMRVHPSNYRIVGFTASPTLFELASLAKESGLLLYEDAGSGVLSPLNEYGLEDEPIIGESIASGADAVSFSGDKLLGSSQAGLIVGEHKLISRLRKHSLYRALRVDKLSLAALEATLEAHRRGTSSAEVPVLQMLSQTKENIEARARKFVEQMALHGGKIRASTVKGESAIGGGSGPNTHPPTTLVALVHENLSAVEIERRLRLFPTPVIARITEGQVVLDLRTVADAEEDELLAAVKALSA